MQVGAGIFRVEVGEYGWFWRESEYVGMRSRIWSAVPLATARWKRDSQNDLKMDCWGIDDENLAAEALRRAYAGSPMAPGYS